MQYKSFMEALKGKQHKLDKNKNGELDAQDFKMLRKEETEETNESYEFNRAALAKQRLMNLRKSGRRVRGASVANLMRAAGIREEEMDETDLDQLDEVLGKDATASDWISDFVHSTNPKFEGKSKKERIKMALGAYYGQAREKQQNEQVQKADIPAYLRKQQGQAPLKLSDLKRKDTISDRENLAKLRNEEKNEKESVPFDPPYKKAEGTTTDKSGAKHTPMSKVRHLARQAMKSQMKEETDTSEKNEMAETQLHFIKYAAEEILDYIKMGGKIEEWYQNKLSKVQSEVESLHSYIEGESRRTGMKEEVQNTGPVKVKVQVAGNEPHEEKWEAAKKKPVKEQYDEEGNVTYGKVSFTDFMEGMTATTVRPGVTRYTGGSYGSAKGAKYGNTDYDKETLDHKDDEGSEEPQKRGRGRPAGSKSGARGPRIK